MADKKWRIQIEDNVESLKQQLIDLKTELTALSSKEYKIDLGIDSQELKSAVENINKLMTNLSKGSNNFKDFQNFTSQIKEIAEYTKSLKELFNSNLGKNGGLITSINNIENSLNALSSAISANASSFDNITNAQKNAASNIDNTNKKLDEQTKKINDATEAQKELNKSQKENTSSTTSKTSTGTSSETSDTEKTVKTYSNLINKINEYNKLRTRNLNASQSLFSADLSDITKLATEIDELRNSLALTEKQITTVETKLNASNNTVAKYMSNVYSSLDSTVNKYESRAYTSQSTEYKKKVSELKSSFEELKKVYNSIDFSSTDSDEAVAQFKNFASSCDEVTESLKQMTTAQKGSKEVSRTKLLGDIDEYLSKNTKLSKEFRSELELLKNELALGGADVDVASVVTQFEQLKVQIREAGQEGSSLKSVIQDKAWYAFAAQIATMFSFYDFINVVKLGIENVIELNTNITELAKVSEASVGQLYDDFSSFAEIAKEVGGTISDTISATADWARNGYTVSESQELAEVAQIYKNVGDDITIDEATESLISTLKGFQLDELGDVAEQALHIVDVFNEVNMVAS